MNSKILVFPIEIFPRNVFSAKFSVDYQRLCSVFEFKNQVMNVNYSKLFVVVSDVRETVIKSNYPFYHEIAPTHMSATYEITNFYQNF